MAEFQLSPVFLLGKFRAGTLFPLSYFTGVFAPSLLLPPPPRPISDLTFLLRGSPSFPVLSP